MVAGDVVRVCGAGRRRHPRHRDGAAGHRGTRRRRRRGVRGAATVTRSCRASPSCSRAGAWPASRPAARRWPTCSRRSPARGWRRRRDEDGGGAGRARSATVLSPAQPHRRLGGAAADPVGGAGRGLRRQLPARRRRRRRLPAVFLSRRRGADAAVHRHLLDHLRHRGSPPRLLAGGAGGAGVARRRSCWARAWAASPSRPCRRASCWRWRRWLGSRWRR